MRLSVPLCRLTRLIAIDLILVVQKQYGGFLPSSEISGLGKLIADNDMLQHELER